MSAILNYGGVKLLNVPHAREVADEVFIEDCYRLESVEPGSVVIDIGAFYGEFAMACAKKKCQVICYEPTPESYGVLRANIELNNYHGFIKTKPSGVHGFQGECRFNFDHHHPAGSRSAVDGLRSVWMDTMANAVNQAWKDGEKLFVKMDCEGAEREIFKDVSWLSCVDRLAMEWHNRDASIYRDILMANGFTVEIEGGGPKPRPAWEPNMSGGLLHAWK